MNSQSFFALQQELAKTLWQFRGKKQNAALEAESQRVVDDIFQKRAARGKLVVLEASGLQISGCKLNFNIGAIGVKSWITKFYPHDLHAVAATVPGAVPLGYVNGYQLYIHVGFQPHPCLVARYGMSHAFVTWSPRVQGIPPGDSVLFVALERAKQLGYLHLLQAEAYEKPDQTVTLRTQQVSAEAT